MNLVTLEENLQNDPSGAFRDKTLAQLEAVNTALEQKIAEGLFVEEFEVAKNLSEAITSAQTIIKFGWATFQETTNSQKIQ